jgi:hypothetical protein
MKRILRWSFNILCILSLLLCMATTGIWCRSYFVGDSWVWYDSDCADCYNTIRSGSGRLRYGWTDMSMYSGINPPPGHFAIRQPEKALYAISRTGDTDFRMPGLRFMQFNTSPGLILDMSHWLLFTVTATLPSIWLVRRLRRRKRAGFCPICNYDLRASPERCPECGAASPA